jgi:hypothetical protein
MAGQFKRHGHIFQRRHGGDQMEGLEDDADFPPAKCRQLVLRQIGEHRISDPHGPGSGPLQSGKHHQKRGLARS